MRPAPDDLGYVGNVTAGLGLFAAPWPEVPRAPQHEQLVAPIDGTIQAAYEAWRATPDGALVYAHILSSALLLAESGQSRIGAKALAERARDELHRHINNSHVALIARDLVRDEPVLRGLLNMRERRST